MASRCCVKPNDPPDDPIMSTDNNTLHQNALDYFYTMLSHPKYQERVHAYLTFLSQHTDQYPEYIQWINNVTTRVNDFQTLVNNNNSSPEIEYPDVFPIFVPLACVILTYKYTDYKKYGDTKQIPQTKISRDQRVIIDAVNSAYDNANNTEIRMCPVLVLRTGKHFTGITRFYDDEGHQDGPSMWTRCNVYAIEPDGTIKTKNALIDFSFFEFHTICEMFVKREKLSTSLEHKDTLLIMGKYIDISKTYFVDKIDVPDPTPKKNDKTKIVKHKPYQGIEKFRNGLQSLISICDSIHDFHFSVDMIREFSSYLDTIGVYGIIETTVNDKTLENENDEMLKIIEKPQGGIPKLSKSVNGKQIEKALTAYFENNIDYLEYSELGAAHTHKTISYDKVSSLSNVNETVCIELGIKPKSDTSSQRQRSATKFFATSDPKSTMHGILAKLFGSDYRLHFDRGVPLADKYVPMLASSSMSTANHSVQVYTPASVFDGSGSKQDILCVHSFARKDNGELFYTDVIETHPYKKPDVESEDEDEQIEFKKQYKKEQQHRDRKGKRIIEEDVPMKSKGKQKIEYQEQKKTKLKKPDRSYLYDCDTKKNTAHITIKMGKDKGKQLRNLDMKNQQWINNCLPNTGKNGEKLLEFVKRLRISPVKCMPSNAPTITNGDKYKIFGMDYKRCGDLLQVKACKNLNKRNPHRTQQTAHVFCTKDRIACLIARVLKVPCIYFYYNAGYMSMYVFNNFTVPFEVEQKRYNDMVKSLLELFASVNVFTQKVKLAEANDHISKTMTAKKWDDKLKSFKRLLDKCATRARMGTLQETGTIHILHQVLGLFLVNLECLYQLLNKTSNKYKQLHYFASANMSIIAQYEDIYNDRNSNHINKYIYDKIVPILAQSGTSKSAALNAIFDIVSYDDLYDYINFADKVVASVNVFIENVATQTQDLFSFGGSMTETAYANELCQLFERIEIDQSTLTHPFINIETYISIARNYKDSEVSVHPSKVDTLSYMVKFEWLRSKLSDFISLLFLQRPLHSDHLQHGDEQTDDNQSQEQILSKLRKIKDKLTTDPRVNPGDFSIPYQHFYNLYVQQEGGNERKTRKSKQRMCGGNGSFDATQSIYVYADLLLQENPGMLVHLARYLSNTNLNKVNDPVYNYFAYLEEFVFTEPASYDAIMDALNTKHKHNILSLYPNDELETAMMLTDIDDDTIHQVNRILLNTYQRKRKMSESRVVSPPRYVRVRPQPITKRRQLSPQQVALKTEDVIMKEKKAKSSPKKNDYEP